MSMQTLTENNIRSAGGDSGGAAYANPEVIPWVRPSDWPAEPTILGTETKIVMHIAVYDDSQNIVSFFTNGAGTHQIDWGDGVVETGLTGGTKTHDYNYASVPGSPTSKGYKVATLTIIPEGGGTLTTWYWYNKPTAFTWEGSSPLLEWFGALPNATLIAFGSSSPTAGHYSLKAVKLYNVDSLLNGNYMFKECYGLEVVEFNCDTSNMASGEGMFDYCYSLQVAPEMNLDGFTGVGAKEMFRYCSALRQIPDYSMVNNRRTQGMFNGCTSLVVGPTLDIHPDGLNMGLGMYQACTNLMVAPPLKIAAGTNGSMFHSCNSLQNLDGWDFTELTDASNMFYRCYSLKRLGDNGWVFPNITNASSMFRECLALEWPAEITLGTGGSNGTLATTFYLCTTMIHAPDITDMSGVVTMHEMFRDCEGLQTIPDYDTSNVQTFSGVCDGCHSLWETPAWDCSNCTAFQNGFDDCYSLTKINLFNLAPSLNVQFMFNATGVREIPATIDLSGITVSTYMNSFLGAVPLREFNAIGPSTSFSIVNAELDAAALNAMYTALPTVGSATVTVTGNPGTSGDNPSIATAKGWTVTG